MNEEEQARNSGEDFRLWYRIRMDDIRFAEGRQLTVTYYVLLLMAAIAGAYMLVDSTTGSITLLEIWALMILAFLLSGIGSLLLIDLQKNLKKYRISTRDDILPHLSPGFSEAVSKYVREHAGSYYTLRHHSIPVLVLIITMFVAASLLAWFLLKQSLSVAGEVLRMGGH